jgi:hypothetical protein
VGGVPAALAFVERFPHLAVAPSLPMADSSSGVRFSAAASRRSCRPCARAPLRPGSSASPWIRVCLSAQLKSRRMYLTMPKRLGIYWGMENKNPEAAGNGLGVASHPNSRSYQGASRSRPHDTAPGRKEEGRSCGSSSASAR